MLSLSEIKNHYPGLKGFDRGILREYLQYKILSIIFQHKLSEKISFLGGTAIKICYGSQRFSEDLDFDNFDLAPNEFETIVNDLKRKLNLENYEVELKIVHKGAMHAYLRFPKILFENNLSRFCLIIYTLILNIFNVSFLTKYVKYLIFIWVKSTSK